MHASAESYRGNCVLFQLTLTSGVNFVNFFVFHHYIVSIRPAVPNLGYAYPQGYVKNIKGAPDIFHSLNLIILWLINSLASLLKKKFLKETKNIIKMTLMFLLKVSLIKKVMIWFRILVWIFICRGENLAIFIIFFHFA